MNHRNEKLLMKLKVSISPLKDLIFESEFKSFFNSKNIMSQNKINETHICVIKRNEEGILYTETIEMISDLSEELEELRTMHKNQYLTYKDLSEFIQKSNLKNTLKSFEFCEFLGGTDQILSPYQFSNWEKIKNKDEYGKRKDKDNLCKRIELGVTALLLEKYYDLFKNDVSIICFSHRKPNFRYHNYQISNDFEVLLNTNFGYGMYSRFGVQIRYFGIQISLYSHWTKNEFLEKEKIINYTRLFSLKTENESWEKFMEFTCGIYNYSIRSPKKFVQTYIVNEIIEMVEDLEVLCKITTKPDIIKSFSNPNWIENQESDYLLNFIFDRITGSLFFISKIQELNKFSDKIPELIERILNCNSNIYVIINEKIDFLENELKNFEIEKMLLQDKLSSTKDDYLLQTKEELKKLENEVKNRNHWLPKFKEFRQEIETYFQSIDRQLL